MTLLDELNENYPKGKTLADIGIRLAGEGVPVRAIARSLPCSEPTLHLVLTRALSAGDVPHMPKDDWPIGWNPSEPSIDDVPMALARRFHLTPLQAKMFAALIAREECSKALLHSFGDENTDVKIVDVVICHLRKRLKEFGLDISTVRSFGYFMRAEHQELAKKLLYVEPTAPLVQAGGEDGRS
jgi:hypothetical protein